MKISVPLFALIASTSAQYYNITSKPFQLWLLSADEKINTTVSACHTGAALESLCLSDTVSKVKREGIPADVFYFNTSAYTSAPSDPDLGPQGIVTWNLPVVGNPTPSSIFFSYDPTTDSAIPIFQPGSQGATLLAFDAEDELIVEGYIDWAADPPKAGPVQAYKRWYACKTYYIGYTYTNLVWGLGPDKPQNPTCVGVSVRRYFV